MRQERRSFALRAAEYGGLIKRASEPTNQPTNQPTNGLVSGDGNRKQSHRRRGANGFQLRRLLPLFDVPLDPELVRFRLALVIFFDAAAN
jgi:hypothetical protein